MRVVVLGGGGFVGRAVCRLLKTLKADVVCITKTGRPRQIPGATIEKWQETLEWHRADILRSPQSEWSHLLKGANGIISCIGALGTGDEMRRICGTATVIATKAAKEQGVERFVFISAHQFSAMPAFFLRSYYDGKRDAEAAVAKEYPDSGLVLRPSFIFGRFGPVSMYAIGALQQWIFSARIWSLMRGIPILGAAFVPWVNVDDVATCAVHAVTNPNTTHGLWDVDEINANAKTIRLQ